MEKLKIELKSYYNTIKKQLACNSSKKKRLLSDLKCNINEFVEDHPESSMGDIIEHFGTPEDIVEGYLSTLEGGDLNKKLKQTKKIRKYVLLTCVLLIIVILFVCVYEYFNDRNYVTGYDEVTINQSVDMSE